MRLSLEGNDKRIVVLKFGSSVLSGVEGLKGVTVEVRRWIGEGHVVVAVVSALAGATAV